MVDAPSSSRRWLVPLGIVVVGAALLVWTWEIRDVATQSKVISTVGTLLIGGLSLFAWTQFASCYSHAAKRSIAWSTVLVGTLTLLLVEVKGFSGDLVPIVAWRFAERAVTDVRPSNPPPREHARSGEDYPQFLGPGRDARMDHVVLETDWERYPPRLVWQQPVGAAWSAFAVRGPDAITQEQDGDDEAVVCYDLVTGTERWRYHVPARFESVLTGDGPRATPTVTEERVFAIGATGILSCLDRATGAELWSHDVVEENDGALLEWGWSSSPLVVDGLVVVNVGGTNGRSLVAYDAEDGSVRWSAGDERHSFSSPQVSTLAGERQIITFNWGEVTGRSLTDGASLWSFPWSDDQPSVAQPVVFGDDLVATSGAYGVGTELHRIDRTNDGTWRVERLWKSRHLKAKFSAFVHANGAFFGLDDGILASIDAETGRRNWKSERYGHGQMILVAGHLLVLTESGDVTLVATDPSEFREVARIHALDGKSWNCPALASPYLLVRNNEEAACYELTLADGPPNASPR